MKTMIDGASRVRARCLSLLTVFSMVAPAAWANDAAGRIPYESLGLTGEQAGRIEQLESNWKRRYEVIYPLLRNEQQNLIRLLADPRSDPIEVTLAQQRIARLKIQFQKEALSNYLGKRSVLDAGQKKKLPGLLRRMLSERARNVF